ncbi:hypothetical protein ABDK00_006210 [Niabella insulamsoli]|uniref:hypothetical protein n=1 Tax=Niabella insulamsoli TaxID=3144874 RepID=UPI0031FC91F0
MSRYTCRMLFAGFIVLFFAWPLCSGAQGNLPFQEFNIYTGSTHAHTILTMSHGEHLQREPDAKKFMLVDSNHLNRPSNMQMKKDWQAVQGLPSMHYEAAKKNRYDFYVCTDHSQEECFFPNEPFNTAWIVSHKQAELASTNGFVGLVGYEHSENDGPGGKGHINVINTVGYLNALEPGVDIKKLYAWLKQAAPYVDGPVVASFNHPSPTQYDSFSGRDEAITDIITMLEVINSNKNIHYEGFLAALDKGWKVAPVCGNDNHGLSAIGKHKSRTFVLAKNNTQKEILEAMKNRRTYASLEENIQCRYSVNDQIMGSTLGSKPKFHFNIHITDPDINVAADKITRIDIVANGGKTVASYEVPVPAHEVHWQPEIKNEGYAYFFVRVWNAGGGDLEPAVGKASPNASQPIAWLAPVWIGP